MSVLALALSRRINLVKEFFTIIVATAILSLLAPIAIPLPFTPVPITFGAQLVLLIGALLGSKRAVLVVSLYLIEGMMGLPVLAGAMCGIHRFFGPTGGYLIGYLIAAFITGFLFERMQKRQQSTIFFSLVLGNLLIFAVGVLHLSFSVGIQTAFLIGFVPFVATELMKLIMAQKVLERLFKK